MFIVCCKFGKLGHLENGVVTRVLAKICYKNALCLNRCNFRTVHGIDLLFSTLHTTPFQYVTLYFGVLRKLCADVTRPDGPWGSKTPHHQVGVSKSLVYT